MYTLTSSGMMREAHTALDDKEADRTPKENNFNVKYSLCAALCFCIFFYLPGHKNHRHFHSGPECGALCPSEDKQVEKI